MDDFPEWLELFQQGDSQAAQQLWEEYFSGLVQVAQRRLGMLPRRTADEEDIAISAMNSFVQGARRDKFPLLRDKTDLWRVLVTITARKVSAQRRRQFAARRGVVRGESVFKPHGDASTGDGIGYVAGREPTPQFAAEMSEQCQVLFDKLDDGVLRDVARWKMEGFSNDEIAEKLGCNVRTVERKLALIRDCWTEAE